MPAAELPGVVPITCLVRDGNLGTAAVVEVLEFDNPERERAPTLPAKHPLPCRPAGRWLLVGEVCLFV